MLTETNNAFWQYSPEYWMQQLNSTANGLGEAEVIKRLLLQGNIRKPVSGFIKDLRLLLSQFKSPLVLLLIGAVILSAFLGDTSDVFIILFIVASTGFMSFFQERNAGKVVEKLQALIALRCTVIRNGHSLEIDSDKIVPGDILLLNAGDMIPADCLLIETNELNTNEASLTGESFPVRKDTGICDAHTELNKRRNSIWQGTSVVSGNAKAIVIATGGKTIFSNIAGSVSVSADTAFEKGTKKFGFLLLQITLVLSILILCINLLNHKNVIDSALFALALAVGMAPELLPAITTIAMSAGANRMLAKKVIVKKLTSIQNLGEINLLCTDKTGTITEGAIEVTAVTNGLGEKDAYTATLAYWNASLESGYNNPIDEVLKHLTDVSREPVQKTGEVPYDFARKRLSIALQKGDERILVTKGAYKELLSICTKLRLKDGTEQDIHAYRSVVEDTFRNAGTNGMRAIGVAYKKLAKESISKDDEAEMVFAGFVFLQDPVKQGIAEAIAALRQLQIGMKIITGDNRNVARAIALQIGIKEPVVVSGDELTAGSISSELLQQAHIFAEVEPQQKEQLIRLLQQKYTVAYMGDGINDVSAINAADVGISVNNAVDIAREAADFVLLEKDLSVLTDGIKEGRKTFANTLKYIYINTGSTFGNMCSVAAASLLLPFLPMLPKQILLTNFITDFPYLAVASDNVDDEQIAKPGKWNLKMIRNYMVIFGIHSSLFDLITFVVLLKVLHVTESGFQTGWFIESVLTELFVLFIIRTHGNFFKSKPATVLSLLSMAGLLLTLALPYLPFASEIGMIPLPAKNILYMMLIVTGYILTADFLKIWFFRKYRSEV